MNNDIIPDFDKDRDDNLNFMLERVDGSATILIVYINGYIDAKNTFYFQNKLLKIIEGGFTRPIIHCGGIHYVSSTGIGAFTTVLTKAKDNGGNVILVDLQTRVYEVFQLLGICTLFTILINLDEAIAIFNASERGLNAAVFPAIIECPSCSKQHRACKAGRFRCSECKHVIVVDEQGCISGN